MKLSENFSTNEVTCRHCKRFKFTPASEKALKLLQILRERFGKPMKVICGYRCEIHNKKVGGVPGSYHKKGQAFDIHMRKIMQPIFAKIATQVGFKGIGFYNTFVHIDNRKKKTIWTK